MTSEKRTARIAGAIYLVVVISGMFSLLYVPSQLIDWNDPGITFNQISNNSQLFRLGIASGFICYVSFLILPLVLFRLLHFVNRDMAYLMVIFAIISVPISLANMQHHFHILTLIDNTDLVASIGAVAAQDRVMSSLIAFNQGNTIAQIFWGLWLFPFGYLVFNSDILPKVLGAFLMLGSIGYVLDFFGQVLFSNYYEMVISSYLTIPASIGELGICAWMLIMGAKNKSRVLAAQA